MRHHEPDYMHEISRQQSESVEEVVQKQTNGSFQDPGYDMDWVSAYCAINELDFMIQYFPYVILLMALSLCVVQKVSNR